MQAILSAAGVVQAVGDASLAVPPGGQAMDVPDGNVDALIAQMVALGEGEELAYDGKAFATRARTLSPQEAASKAAKALILPVAQGTVGKHFDALVATEVRALVVLMLYQQGAIGADGTVQPLTSWLRD